MAIVEIMICDVCGVETNKNYNKHYFNIGSPEGKNISGNFLINPTDVNIQHFCSDCALKTTDPHYIVGESLT